MVQDDTLCANETNRPREKIKDDLLKLTRMVYEDNGLQAIVNHISEIYQAPCNILDLTYRHIARSDNQWGLEENDFFIRESKQGYVTSVEGLERMRRQGTFKKEQRPMPLHIPEINMNAWLYPLSISGVEIAYLSVIRIPGSFREELLSYMPDICGILGLEMQKDSFYKYNKGAVFSNYLQDLLQGKMHDPAKLEQRFNQLGYEMKSNKYVVYIDIHEKARFFHQGYMMGRQLQQEFRNSIFLLEDGAIIMLITRNDNEVVTVGEIQEQSCYLRTDGLYAGMSSAFWDVSQMPYYLRQAKSAFVLGRKFEPEKHLFIYDEYRVMDMIRQWDDYEDVMRYCYPPLMRLIAYDRKNNTEMTRTLYYYLENMKDTAHVLETMHIHRNTLFYRLKKTREIFGSDMTDAREIMQIELTFEILKYVRVVKNA